MRLSSPSAPTVTIQQGGNTAAVLAATATQDESLAQFLATVAAVYAFDGTDLSRLASESATYPNLLVGLREAGRQLSIPNLTGDVNSALVTPVLNPTTQEDVVINDSDKTITVPANRQWHILALNAYLTTTATVGNRQLDFRINSSGAATQWRSRAGQEQAASSAVLYMGLTGMPRETARINGTLFMGWPADVWLAPADAIRVLDINAVDASGDDLEIKMLVDERVV